jgi:hypothetical protein
METRLKIIMYWIVAIWVVAQVILIVFLWGTPLSSDPATYIDLAQKCFNNGEWYPMQEHMYSAYIWAPGFVNFLILQLNLFGTVNLNPIFNLLMNIGVLLDVYYLGTRFFSKQVATFSVITYCLLYSNLMIVVPACTEIPFLFLALSGFSLSLLRKTKFLIIGGVLLALANWIRPLSIIFLFVLLAFLFVKKSSIKSYITLLISFLLIVFFIGIGTYNKVNYFIFQSTTSGFNLIQTANDHAYGGVEAQLFGDSTSTLYIKDAKSVTFTQKDSIWKKRSYYWIKEHPVKYIALYFKKIGGLYAEDSWSDKPIFGGNGFISKYVSGNMTKSSFVKFAIKMGLKSIIYYVVLLLFFISLFIHRKTILSDKGLLLLLLIIGTLSNCLLIVSSRYHYTYLFVIILFAASTIDYYLRKKDASKYNKVN